MTRLIRRIWQWIDGWSEVGVRLRRPRESWPK